MNSLLSCLSLVVMLIDSVLAIILLSSFIVFKNVVSEFWGVLLFTATAIITGVTNSSRYTRYIVLFVAVLSIVFLLSDLSINYGIKIIASVLLLLVFGSIKFFYEVLIEKRFSMFPTDTTLQPILVRLFNIVMSRMLLIIVVLIIRNRNVLSSYSHIQVSLLFLYVCFSLTIIVILADQFANTSPFDDFILVCSFLYGTGTCLYVLLFFSVKKRDEKIREDSLIIQQLKNEYLRYENISLYLEELEAWKHDMRKHFQSLLNIMNSANPEKDKLLSSYLFSIQEGLYQSPYLINTNNSLFDSVVSMNCALAVDSKIEVQLDMVVPQLSFIDPVDLVAVLGNLWENAIDGCVRANGNNNCNTSILFKTFVSINHFVMELTNTCINNVDTDLHSSKTESGHGIGIKVIKKLVDKYHGVYGYKVFDNTFVSRVAIPINSEVYDDLSSCVVFSWTSVNNLPLKK